MENTQRTVNGKTLTELYSALEGLVTVDDYKFKDNGEPYLPENVIQKKFRRLLQFNLRQVPYPVDSEHNLVKVMDIEGKRCVVTVAELQIIDDDGNLVTSVAKLGSSTITMKNDGSGPVSIENDIKSAETDSVKRGISSFCPKPDDYAEKVKKKSGNGNGYSKPSGSGNFKNNNKVLVMTFTKAAYLSPRTRMISGAVTASGESKDFAIYSKTAETIAKNSGLTVEQLAAKLKAGATIKAEVYDDSYAGKDRWTCVKIVEFLEVKPNDSAEKSNVESKPFEGLVKLTSEAKTDGKSIQVKILAGPGEELLMHISREMANVLCQKCNCDFNSLVGFFKAGLPFNVTGVVQNKVLYLKTLANTKKGGNG